MKQLKIRSDRNPGHHFAAFVSKPFAVLWAVGVLMLIVVSLIPQASISEIETGFGKDKLARVVVFLILAFYPAAFFSPIRLGLMMSTSIAPLGFLLELVQRYVPGRHFSPEDMIANNLGAVVGIILALGIRFFFRTGRVRFGFRPTVPDTYGSDREGERQSETQHTSNQ
jgi:VanZ family protein